MVIMGLGIINNGVDTLMEFNVECRMSTIIVGGWVNETATRRVNETAMLRVNETATRRVGGTATRRVGGTATRQWPHS